jgi:anti-sigma regulatory factor (Ser/Thr protein kinase)
MDAETITLHGDRTAPAVARSAVRHLLAPVLPRDAMERVALMTSEAVNNAVTHDEDGAMILSVAQLECAVRIAVEDQRRGTSRAASGAWGDGLGMLIVSRLSDRWGARPVEQGTEVWFEVDLPPRMT